MVNLPDCSGLKQPTEQVIMVPIHYRGRYCIVHGDGESIDGRGDGREVGEAGNEVVECEMVVEVFVRQGQ